MAAPRISIVVAAFNEEGNIDALLGRIRASLAAEPVDYELLLVDDGSRDSSWERIRAAAAGEERIRGIRLVRNFGHQSALLAGLAACTGDAAITMDADLQHPPELLPKMIAAWRDGAPVVLTRRRSASGGAWFKRGASAAFYRFFSAFTGVETGPGSSDFRLLHRAVLDQLLAFRGSHGFLRGAVNWLGYPTVTLEYEVGRRASGQSKYSVARMVRFAITAIVTFTTRPLYIGIWLGAALALFAFLELFYVLVQYARGVTVPGWASLVGLYALLSGFQFLLLGIIGLYIARIHTALQAPPSYIIAEQSRPGAAADKKPSNGSGWQRRRPAPHGDRARAAAGLDDELAKL